MFRIELFKHVSVLDMELLNDDWRLFAMFNVQTGDVILLKKKLLGTQVGKHGFKFYNLY